MPPSHLKFANRQSDVAEDIVIALDASPSMDDTDLRPSRLTGAKNAITSLIDLKSRLYSSDRVGLVSFSDRGRVQSPLLAIPKDKEALQRALKNISTRSCTNITSGLKEAFDLLNSVACQGDAGMKGIPRFLHYFFFEPPPVRTTEVLPAGSACKRTSRIILVSDGCFNKGGDPTETSGAIKAADVLIDVIGVGGSHDSDELDEPLLKTIASKASDGSPRYCFICDTQELIQKFEELGRHIVRSGRQVTS